MKKVAIIGNGWVGKAMQELFPDAHTYVRDVQKSMDEDQQGHLFTNVKEHINECDVAFICVPTPVIHSESIDPTAEEMAKEDRLDTSAVEECIRWCECDLIVIRSTVNPGDCDRWTREYGKSIVFQPEYLGETPAHPLLDTAKTNFMILGGDKKNTRKLIDLYTSVFNANTTIRQVSLKEAEIIKLSENRAIAFKVAQCQELYDVCAEAGVDYYTVRDAVYGDDPRFTLWWTFVFLEKRGFNSKCIPKDVYAWCAWAESLGYDPKITRAIVNKNKEWIG